MNMSHLTNQLFYFLNNYTIQFKIILTNLKIYFPLISLGINLSSLIYYKQHLSKIYKFTHRQL